jgi:hypothetical protein
VLGGERVGEAEGVRIAVVRDEAPRVRLREPGPDEDVLNEPAKALLAREAPAHRARARKREGHLLEAVDPRHLLDEVDLARDVARPPRGRCHGPVAGHLEAEPEQRAALVGLRNGEADDRVGSTGPQARDGTLGELAVRLGPPGRLTAHE